jgi:hypothetical protein
MWSITLRRDRASAVREAAFELGFNPFFKTLRELQQDDNWGKPNKQTEDVAFGSWTAVAGWPLARPVNSQLRKSPCGPALTFRASRRR